MEKKGKNTKQRKWGAAGSESTSKHGWCRQIHRKSVGLAKRKNLAGTEAQEKTEKKK